MPKEIKYGYIRGPSVFTDEWPLAASIVFDDKGFKWVAVDTSNRLAIVTASSTDILGHVSLGAATGGSTFTASSTAGQDKAEVNISTLSVFRGPSDADPANVRGETCDIVLSGNIQQADIGGTVTDILMILAADTADDTVDVHLWSPNLTRRSVA